MAMVAGQNFNHPEKGSSIKVEPIRDIKSIKRIKKNLEKQPRNYCLFTLGINSAYRANELLSLSVDQVDYLRPGDRLELKQSKTDKHRAITVNSTAVDAIDFWLRHHPRPTRGQPLFISHRKHTAIGVPTACNLLKKWCHDIGLHGNFGSHTLRKTWGYFHHLNGTPLPLLMEAFGHSTQKQTLDYLCIQSSEIQQLYTDLEL